MHTPGGVDQVKRPHALIPIQPRKKVLGDGILEGDRPKTMVQLQHPRDRELAQPAVRVVKEPGPFRRAAA
jgi:hypothetical protein